MCGVEGGRRRKPKENIPKMPLPFLYLFRHAGVATLSRRAHVCQLSHSFPFQTTSISPAQTLFSLHRNGAFSIALSPTFLYPRYFSISSSFCLSLSPPSTTPSYTSPPSRFLSNDTSTELTNPSPTQEPSISKGFRRKSKARQRGDIITRRKIRSQSNLPKSPILPRRVSMIQVVGTHVPHKPHGIRPLYKRPFAHHRQLSPFSFRKWIIGIFRSLRKFLTGGRPWTLDRLYGLFSVIAIGTTTWIIVGTTSAFSALIFIANFSETFQQKLIDRIGRLATEQTGIEMSFKKADVASWFDAAIRLQVRKIISSLPDLSTSSRRMFPSSVAAPKTSLQSKFLWKKQK